MHSSSQTPSGRETMTPDEMRQEGERLLNAGEKLLGGIELAAAEICERLDKIIDRLEEPHNCYTKTDDDMLKRLEV